MTRSSALCLDPPLSEALGRSPWQDMERAQPWYWRSLPLNHRTGQDIFTALFLDAAGDQTAGVGAIATLLESPYPTHQFCDKAQQLSRYSICAGPPRQIDGQPRLWTPPLGGGLDCLQHLHCLHRSGLAAKNQGLPEESELPFQGAG